MHTICALKKEIYRLVEPSVDGDEIIITDERIDHVHIRHEGDWERYGRFAQSVLSDPDIILRDGFPSTAIVLKKIDVDGTEKYIRATVRLHTPDDDKEKTNSVISYQKINKKEFGRLSRNKNVLYRKE